MITTMPKDELIVLGSRLRGMYLFEQSGYTLGIGSAEGAPLAALMPTNYQAEVKTVAEEVEAALKDRRNATAESQDATKGQNLAMRASKIWMRKVSRRALLARRLGQSIPDGLVKLSAPVKVPQMLDQMATMVKLLEANAAKMAGSGIPAVITEGKALALAMKSADADQEIKRMKALPDSVRNYYHKKGLLYIGLKAINDAGNALYASDRTAAARFNFAILHRGHGRKKAAQPAAAGGATKTQG